MLNSGRFRLAAIGLVGSLVVAGCAGSPGSAVGTPCGGSHDWPPNGYGPAPAGLSVEIVSGTTVRVRNDTAQSWVVSVAAWEDLGCVGYLSAEPTPRRDLAAHDAFEVTVADPVGWGGRLRIGVEFWDHPCGDTCQDQPTGFGFVDPPVQPSPT